MKLSIELTTIEKIKVIADRRGMTNTQLAESTNINFKNVTVIPKKGPAFLFTNVNNFKGEKLASDVNNRNEAVAIKGSKTSNITLDGFDKSSVVISDNVDINQITIK